VSDAVHLTFVSSEPEAAVVCGLLRSEGIQCAYRQTNAAAGALEGSSSGGSQEILVRGDQLERAREVLAGSESA
jgi:hypothetical protein